MENKISKICWNSKGWKFPSGSKGKSAASNSFEAEYGYGHEEWLFDKARIVNGYHYAFLQPLNLKSNKHVAKTYNISLFTITAGIKYYVGEIKNAECISKEESRDIYAIYKRNGWLEEMVREIERAGADPTTFIKISPDIFFNVKFKFEDVIRPDEVEELSAQDFNITTTRYKLLPKTKSFTFVAEISDEDNEGRFKNTKKRNRIYKVENSFDPYHDKLQNALCALLRNNYKNEYKTVAIEKDRVDIKAKTHSDTWHYFEIKTDNPKLSIRNALGQLLEYSYWPDSEWAGKLFIISDNPPDSDTKKYLAHIRGKFNLPIFYRSFDMEANVLSEEF